MNPPALHTLAPAFATRLAVILRALAVLIARAYLRHPRAALIFPLVVRLQRTARVIAAIMAGLAAGRTPRLDPRRNRPRPATPPFRLPTAHGWLLTVAAEN